MKDKWIICPTCEGEGKHSLALGAITEEDREQWSPEEWQNYIHGGYDQRCETCAGTGKITDEQRAARDEEMNDPAWKSEQWLRDIGG